MKMRFLAVMALTVTTAFAQEQELLDHSIVGSEACEKNAPCYSEIMDKVPVQRFFLELAKVPIDAAKAEAVLQGTGVSTGDLLALRLVRREGNRYVLNFPLFTAADVTSIRERSEGYADSLAQAMMARRDDFDAALATYDAPGVDRRAVAYFLLGCVSLDWDGLEITAKHDYRRTAEKRPNGEYVPAAEEKTGLSLKGIYWGSHNSRFGETGFTSFGDHFSGRFMFPDLVWGLAGRVMRRDTDPEGAQEALQTLVWASLQDSAADVGRIMLALREGEKSADEVAAAARVSPGDTKALLRGLAGIQYVTEKDGRYRAAVPVLTERDRAAAEQVRKIGREVMERWLAANYPKMKVEMKDLSFTRSGVPFEEGFTMIWHYIFGITNRKLTETGLFPDPYAPERRYKGSIPAVYSLQFSLP